MATTIGVLSTLVLIVLLVWAGVSAIRKSGKTKKLLMGVGICFIIMIIAMVNTPSKAKPLATAPEQSVSPSSPIVSPSPSLSPSPPVADKKLIPAHIVKVVDGDTMHISFKDGDTVKNETVRLLLIDTPETVDPSKPVQPFGREASDFAKETLNDKDVNIEIDVSERDKYGRLLCYLYIGDKMFNEMQLEKGFARVAYVYPPNVKYVDKFREIQKKTQETGVGIWSIENYAKEDGFHEDVVSPKPPAVPTQQPTVKPTPPPTKAPAVEKPTSTPKPASSNVSYKNCTEVKNAGAAPLYEGDPGYSTKLDRDKDGVACEK